MKPMKEESIEKKQTKSQQYIPYISGSQYDVDMALLEDEEGNQFVVPLKQVLDYFDAESKNATISDSE